MENKITISIDEYRELLKEAERASVIRKLVTKDGYASTGDIMAILCIEKTEGKTDGKA